VVLKSTSQRKTIVALVVLFVLMIAAMILLLLQVDYLKKKQNKESAQQNSAITEVEQVEKPAEEPPVTLPEKVDFQPVVDAWVASVGGNKSVLIYDLERGEVAGMYNVEESYNTASLYKLFVVYEGYRRVQSGEWDGAAMAGSTGYTISECLDLSIRESYSPCAETLWGMIGYDELDRIIAEDFGITGSDISHLISNPEDIRKMLQIFYEHKDITDEGLVAMMKDSFLNQPATTYDWRQGLPSGFTKAKVYNKVGWDWNGKSWNVYHDAAIVEFPEQDRHFIVVVMTSQVPHQKIRELGTSIEKTYLNL